MMMLLRLSVLVLCISVAVCVDPSVDTSVKVSGNENTTSLHPSSLRRLVQRRPTTSRPRLLIPKRRAKGRRGFKMPLNQPVEPVLENSIKLLRRMKKKNGAPETKGIPNYQHIFDKHKTALDQAHEVGKPHLLKMKNMANKTVNGGADVQIDVQQEASGDHSKKTKKVMRPAAEAVDEQQAVSTKGGETEGASAEKLIDYGKLGKKKKGAKKEERKTYAKQEALFKQEASETPAVSSKDGATNDTPAAVEPLSKVKETKLISKVKQAASETPAVSSKDGATDDTSAAAEPQTEVKNALQNAISKGTKAIGTVKQTLKRNKLVVKQLKKVAKLTATLTEGGEE